MHSISAILIKLFTKPFIKAGAKLICISLLFITQTAHADFRKALDAYMARDGATMLKEVKDAVGKRNDERLHIFIMQLRQQYMAKSFLFETEKAKQKSGHINIYSFSTLLPEKQSTELISLLNQAVQAMLRNNDYFESKAAILFIQFADMQKLESDATRSKAWKALAIEAKGKLNDREVIEIISNGMFESCEVKEKLECLILSAELGNPYDQSDLGHIYFGESNLDKYIKRQVSGFRKQVKLDKQKAYYWLEQSVINSEFPATASAYCTVANYYQHGDETHVVDLKQAYLLYVWDYLSVSYRADSACAKDGLVSLLESGDLKKVAPEYYDEWMKKKEKYGKKIAPPPKQFVQVTELPLLMNSPNITKDEDLIFSYSPSFGSRLNIYKDGLAVFKKRWTIGKCKIEPSAIKKVIKDLRTVGFAGWGGFDTWSNYIDYGVFGSPNKNRFAFFIRDESFVKTVHGDRPDLSKMIYQLINKKFPNKYMSCGQDGQDCLYQEYSSRRAEK